MNVHFITEHGTEVGYLGKVAIGRVADLDGTYHWYPDPRAIVAYTAPTMWTIAAHLDARNTK